MTLIPRNGPPRARHSAWRAPGRHDTPASRVPRARRVAAAAVIVTAALLAAVWVAPRASGAAGEWMRTPPVHTQTMAVPGGDLRVAGPAAGAASPVAPELLDPGMRFTMVGVICDVPEAAGGVTLRLRTSLDGTAWSPWVETPLETTEAEGGGAQAFTDPLWTGPARYVQVGAAAAGTDAPTELSGVRLVAIDPTESADAGAAMLGTIRRLAARLAGMSLVPPASAAANAPTIVTRAEWGADESLRTGSPSYATVKMAFIHHTASGNTYSPDDAAAVVRGVYAYHTKSLGWSDIGYNFLIDRYGTIFEGRFGGTTRGVVGAQVLGFNTGSTGISVMGTFTSAVPPTEGLTSLEKLLAWKLTLHGLDPTGTARLTCGATEKYAKGTLVTFPVIAGHRQANHTECPGTAFYALLPAIRTEVASRTQAPVVATLDVSESLISPNGDGVLDATVLGVKIGTPADWALALRDAGGATVASWSGQGTTAQCTWRGDGASGGAADGLYTAELTASSSLGEAFPATVTIIVDTAPPRLSSATVTPVTFSPNGDGQAETSRLTYVPAEACAVRVGIRDANGVVRRWLHGWRARGTGGSVVAWDGRLSRGGKLVAAADGRYTFLVERRDEAGNVARQGLRVSVDRTLSRASARPVTISPDGDRRRDSTTLSFRLARRATVTIALSVGADTIRILKLGRLAAGAHSAVWNGKSAAGKALESCRPAFTVTAVSALGESSVRKGLVVDRYRPRLSATAGKDVALGTSVTMNVKADDPFSAKVDLAYTIVDARGRTISATHVGWVKAGTTVSVRWMPKGRGVYTVVYRATDLGGNREASPVRTVLTVR